MCVIRLPFVAVSCCPPVSFDKPTQSYSCKEFPSFNTVLISLATPAKGSEELEVKLSTRKCTLNLHGSGVVEIVEFITVVPVSLLACCLVFACVFPSCLWL